ncbi:predicted protein [Streptomyces pristinaespiralis ATCC 25486]|uniref:Predicted protein n=1 Tax=Streptomyces pristinaespiralis (strain ATCC 25486 / DSM 40338 / CBS 914.69 / JCM 4507 / KCC S-0507 / NBRC 13074 / NRRL 2958 / 5647) TaxID=457429 RepID=B5H4H0_STRE2|nr:predicted protein [Streptomyces pristinaespiralis ATCC 25486]
MLIRPATALGVGCARAIRAPSRRPDRSGRRPVSAMRAPLPRQPGGAGRSGPHAHRRRRVRTAAHLHDQPRPFPLEDIPRTGAPIQLAVGRTGGGGRARRRSGVDRAGMLLAHNGQEATTGTASGRIGGP